MLTSNMLPIAFLIPLCALIAETCQDPFLRSDPQATGMWQRLFMFFAGAVLLEVYRSHSGRSLKVLTAWVSGNFLMVRGLI